MYLVFDIGGTNMRLASAYNGKIIKSRSLPTPQDFKAAMSLFKITAKELLTNNKCIEAAGGVPGPLNNNFSQIINAPNLRGWNNMPLKNELEKILDCPVKIFKDVGAAALGEAGFGAGRGKKIVVYYTVSTGVGAARVIDSQIDQTTVMCEPGYQVVKHDIPKGNIEALVSGTGLKNRFGKSAEELKDTKIWDEAANYLAIAIHNSIIHWDPDVVVIGGSVMKSLDIRQVEKKLQRLPRLARNVPPLKLAELGDDVGLHGALAYLEQKK